MTVRPLHDRLLIKRIEEKETVKGGIIIPDTAKEKPQEGEVIAVGNGKKTEEGNEQRLIHTVRGVGYVLKESESGVD